MYIIEAVPEFKIDLDEALQKLCSVKGKPPPPHILLYDNFTFRTIKSMAT